MSKEFKVHSQNFEESGVNWVRLSLTGSIDENAVMQFDQIDERHLPRHVEIDFEQVDAMNSSGVRNWILFLRSMSSGRVVRFVKCGPDVVMQINMIPAFSEGANVHSLFATFLCRDCGHEHLEFFQVPKIPRDVDDVHQQVCQKCGGASLFDEDESFFSFVRD